MAEQQHADDDLEIQIHSAEAVDKPVLASPYAPPVEIIVEAAAWQLMNQHARENLRHEAGGVMLGEIYEHQGTRAIRVTTAVAARQAINDIASIQFTYETWKQMEEDRRLQAPSEKLIGWYHTHPGFSAFFSETDRFMHQHFFDQPWHVALVIDPIKGEHRFFRWEEGQIREVSTFLLQIGPGASDPRPPLNATLSHALHRAARQLEDDRGESADALAGALRKLVGSLRHGPISSPRDELLPFLVACAELDPELVQSARDNIQPEVSADSPIELSDLAPTATNSNPRGAISIVGGILAQKADRHHLHLHGLDQDNPFCETIELEQVIDDLTLDEQGHVVALVQDGLYRLEPSIHLLTGVASSADRRREAHGLTPLEIDWQGQRPNQPIGKILAARRALYLLTRDYLYVLTYGGEPRPPRCQLHQVHKASECGWRYFDLLGWTSDPVGNLYLLSREGDERLWRFDRLEGRLGPLPLDESLVRPVSLAAGLTSLWVYDSGDPRRVVQFALADGRLLCRRPLDENLRRLRLRHLFSDGFHRLYLVTDDVVFQTR